MSKNRRQCKYIRRWDKWRCTRDAEPDSEHCIWHKEVDGKHLSKVNVSYGEDLIEAYLKGASLLHANLQGADLIGANFRDANLHFAKLQDATLWGANFEQASLEGANLQGAELLLANLQGSILAGADLRGADLSQAYLRDVSLFGCRFDGSTLKYARRPITVMEKDRSFRDIADDHRCLMNYFRVEGYYDEVSDHYYKEREFRTKALGEEGKRWPWIANMAYEWLCGYGERPLRTVGFSFLLIFLYFLIFSILGMSIDQALLFSVLSFTTLGYGASMTGSTPLQLFAASEALFGIFMMALLAFTFARKVER